ncbi:uncharacterized protein METZ01_LOCUS484103 [marine metagenome]|uniref:Uncharacterized protein n=1 Tax=marine metagenome TaxID=408172 RepID=A0A383CGQ3_9ZZZZ
MGVIVKTLRDHSIAERDYLKDPNFCPYCEHPVIEAVEFDVEGRVAWQSVLCRRCGAEWNDVYELVAVEKVEIP